MDLTDFFADLGAWAAQYDGDSETHRYGAHPEQEADLRTPPGAGPHPLAMILHGGNWRARFDRMTTQALAVDLVLRGWATLNVEYRRVGCGGGVPATLDDVAAAIAMVERLPAAVDRRRLVVIGHSAGGHLALWSAGGGGVAAVVTLAGICDLTEAARLGIGDAAAVEFAGGAPAEQPERYALADPIGRLPTGALTLLAHGIADESVPCELSRRYAHAARRSGDRCELLELPGVNHFQVIDPRHAAWQAVAERLDSLIAT